MVSESKSWHKIYRSSNNLDKLLALYTTYDCHNCCMMATLSTHTLWYSSRGPWAWSEVRNLGTLKHKTFTTDCACHVKFA
jgi:hypothetical protein